MIKMKKTTCDKCNGYGFISHCKGEIDENGYGWGHAWSESCNECNGLGTVEVPMTNADDIRLMSNDELAEFIHSVYWDGYEDGVFEEPYVIRDNSFMKDINKIKEWLEKDMTRSDDNVQ